MTTNKKLYRDPARAILGGVCAGMADYTGIDVSRMRLAAVLIALVAGMGFIAYLILWIALPKKP